MTYVDLILRPAIHEAKIYGDTAVPRRLKAVLHRYKAPLDALLSHDHSNKIFDALHADFQFLRLAHATQQALKAEDQKRYVELIRWFSNELISWRKENDHKFEKMAAIIVVAQALGGRVDIWPFFSNKFSKNAALCNAMANIILNCNIEIPKKSLRRMLNWEGKVMSDFKEADKARDWSAIDSGMNQFGDFILLNVVIHQAARWLFRFDFDLLCKTIKGLKGALLASSIIKALSREQGLRLALCSENQYIQFSCMREAISGGKGAHVFAPKERELAADLLLCISKDPIQWAEWMKVFNSYPIRYPALQRALGRALAHVSDSALEGYINSIHLYISDNPNRLTIGECLATFRSKATPARRKILWVMAYERWKKWNFDATNPETYLFNIAHSPIDYAVIGYTKECLSKVERKHILSRLNRELISIDSRWHVSMPAFITDWYRILSNLQPYLHVYKLGKANNEWLASSNYLPFDPAQEPYLQMRVAS